MCVVFQSKNEEKMKRLITVFLSLWIPVILMAQVIRLDFPHFAGKEFVYVLVQGGSNDTIQRSALDEKGQGVLIVPKRYAGYAGVSLFRLTDGGGLDIILNKEKAFLVRCTEAQPTDETVFYVGSPENHFLHQNYTNQEAILNKYSLVRPALDVYSSKDSLYPLFERESQRLEAAYSVFYAETAKSPLYAARLRAMQNFLMGLASRLDLTEKEGKQELFDFVSKQLDLKDLYTSNLWHPVLDQWMNRQSERADDDLLVKDTKVMLARTSKKASADYQGVTGQARNDKHFGSVSVNTALLNKIIALYSRFGKDELLLSLGVDLLGTGNRAPALIKENAKFVPINSVVIFYESGCNQCENELVQLRGNYSLIKAKGYEVISVAADLDKETFEKTSTVFPWKEKICDYKGFEGVNFENYGIVGTPTIFVTDKEGTIVGRYARLADMGI
jgi:hypothetical protein